MKLLAVLIAALCLAAPAMAQPARPPLRPSADRPILLVDQVRSAPFPRAWAPLFQPLKTLEEVEAVLKSKGVPFQRGRSFIDTRTANPELVRTIAALPPGEIFIVPQGRTATFSRVLGALTPEAAAAAARPNKAPPRT